MPKVSVIVPVYKVEPFIHRCVDSILGQSVSDLELILVDDGSPDTCGDTCDAYARQDHRVHVIHQENGGLSAARNAGLDWVMENSDSQWLTFIDSDDWVHRDFLKLLLDAADYSATAMAVCDAFWTDRVERDAQIDRVDVLALDSEDALVNHYARCTTAWAKVFRKDLFRQLRFPVGKLHEDAFVMHIPLFASGRVAIVPEKLYYYYNNTSSITRSRWNDRKLDGIEAHELRLVYFRDHGYSRAYRRQQEMYVEELTDKLMHLSAEGKIPEEFAGTFDMLRGKLRTALKTARADGLVKWNGETMWSYFYAMETDVVWKTMKSFQRVYHNLKK